MEIDYTIIIRAYNPDERLLKRCLEALYNLDVTGIPTEVLLLDNNSLNPLDRMQYVREYVRKIPSMRILLLPNQGVKQARIAAIEDAKGKHIVYIDYDNEPEKNYLQELKKLNTQYPNVAAWGPGDLSVDFIDGIDKKIEDYARIAFQERHNTSIQSACLPEWQSCYPFRAGLCVHSFLLKEYNTLIKQGKFKLQDKKENQLIGEEDAHLVLLCISKGYFAGVSPTLQLKYIIPEVRANYQYIKQLLYGTGLSYETCLLQVFPEYLGKLQAEIVSKSKFSFRALKEYLKVKLSSDPQKKFELISYIALNAGAYVALDKPMPPLVKKIVKNLKLA